MQKSCLHCQAQFEITQDDLDFYNKISPTFAGEKFPIPAPHLCSDCRQRRRMTFRNERNLYRRTCDASGKQIISMYAPKEVLLGGAPKEVLLGDSPECGYKVYDQKIWRSDQWNPMDYGRDFDFTKSFTENLKELSLQVPRPSMYNFYAENSDYCNCTSYQKDCYLTSASTINERCLYSAYTNHSKNCVDNVMTFDCENSYYTLDCEKSYKLIYASNCRNCSESYFITNCTDCSFCRNCEGLENKKYCIDNIQYDKEEYNLKIQDLRVNRNNFIQQRSQKKQHNTILFSQDSTGNHLRYCMDTKNSFDGGNLENCVNCTWFFDAKECRDNYSWDQNAEMCYENVAVGENIYGIHFCANVNTNCNSIRYSMHCRSSKNCFGCVGLHDAEYCIFNKQYSKEDYEIMVGKIIRHMMNNPYVGTNLPATGGASSHPPYQEGQSSEHPRRDALSARPGETYSERGEFFHPSLSPFGYNETVAQEYYPLSQDVIARNGAERNDEAIHNHINQIATSEESGFPTSSQGRQRFGYHRSTYESPKPVSDKVIKGSELGKYDPVGMHGNASDNTIRPQSDDILQYAIQCEVSGKLFRIQAAELAFYRKHHIPLPRKHPDVRHMERMKLRK